MSNNNKKMREDVAASVLEKIKKGDVTPRPLWHFTLSNLALWASGIFFLIVGAISVSLIVLILDHGLWEEESLRGGGRVEHAFRLFPFFWLVAFLLFLFVAEYLLSYTKKAYRYSLSVIISVLFGVSVVCGLLLYIFGVSHTVDQRLGNSLPQYKMAGDRLGTVIHNPERGQFVGVIRVVSSNEEQILIYSRHDESKWRIDYSNAQFRPPHFKEQLRQGQHIIVKGVLEGNMIRAEHIAHPKLSERVRGNDKTRQKPGGQLRDQEIKRSNDQ